MKKTTLSFKKRYLSLILLVISSLFINKASATVTITKPNLSITTCSGFPSGYNALGNIVIKEGSNSDFTAGASVTLILTAPTNFEFKINTGSVTFASGNNITAATLTSITSTTITITYSSSSTNKTDILTISGIFIRATNSASTGNIKRTGGSGVITGLVNTTTLTNTLTSIAGSAIPTINTQPIATSVCTTGITTFSVAATGATSYQWRRNGVNLTNTAPYSNVTTATLSLTNPAVGIAGNFDVVINTSPCWITSNAVALTVNTVPSPSITPSPTDAATGVCYGGASPVTSISWAATATATSYDVYFGAGSLPETITSNVLTNTYTTGTLLANTTYHWKVVAKNGCGDAVGSTEWTFTTAASPCVTYCTPSTTSGVDDKGITNVSYSSVNYASSDTGVYNNYTAQIGTAIQGSAMPITVKISVGKNKYNLIIWVDWNNDGDFADAGEQVFTDNTSNTSSGNINIPANASVGNHRMRIGITRRSKDNNVLPTPCHSDNETKAAFEDYTLNVTSSSTCSLAPTVSSNPANTTITNGGNTTFTATFANTPTSYLWEESTDGGINYTPITNGGVYSTATTATLTITGATGNMSGYKYRISASNACGISSLSATATLTVTISAYCTISRATPATSKIYWIASFASEGNLNDVSYTGSSANNVAYNDYSNITIATQVPGGGMNFSVVLGTTETVNPANRQYLSAYVDWNGDGDFVDVGETVYTTGTTGLLQTSFGFPVPTTQAPANYRMRVRSKIADGTAIVLCTNYTSGETEDYTIAVVRDCAAKIESITNGSECGTHTVALSAVGLGGTTEYRWYSAAKGGTLLDITTIGSWTTPSLTVTTTYYVTSFNGSCESLVRTPVVATIVPTTVLSFTPANPVACGEDSIITLNAAGDTQIVNLLVESFEDETLGNFSVATTTNLYDTNGDHVGDSPQPNAPWRVQTNTYQPTDTSVWKPAMSSGNIGEGFAFTSSDYSYCTLVTDMETTTNIDTRNYVNLTLTFNHYYSNYSAADNAKLQVYNGTSWVDVVMASYTTDTGSASKFKTETVDLSAYVGIQTFKFRFRYTAGWCDGWAIDDIRLFGTKLLNTAFSWTSPPGTTVNAYSNLACTIPYDPATKVDTIYLKPDLSQLETDIFPITVTATLDNSCPVSQLINVANKTKVWRGDVTGTADTTLEWNNPNNWRPVGVPDATNCVIGPENTVISGTNLVAHAKNVVVKSTGTFELQAGNNLIVEDWIHVETGGVFNVRNNASILQTNDDQNTGNVNIERITQPMNYYDYTYWNSPVTAGSNFTFASLSPSTSSDIWSYSATVSGGSGNWVNLTPSTVIIPTKGYIVKAPDTFSNNPSTKAAFTATFVGTPNNGPILAPVSKGNNSNLGVGSVADEDDEWNLIGNPYPSGLDAKAFLDLPANVPVVDGTIYIWTHNTQPSAAAPDPFYGDYVLNYTSEDYASFNKTGATGTKSSATTGGNAPTGYIASGQAFFVRAATTRSNGTTANATFNNSMRVTNNANPTTGTNSDFFKTRKNSKVTIAEEKHRIWLNLTDNSGAFSQALIGYITDATQGLDRGFDGESFGGNDVTFYSIIPEANLTIQGRALPFDSKDTVALGFNAAKEGNYSIRIDHLDGLFDNQNIYLEDKDLNIIYDLKEKPYVFDTKVGTFDNRFVLRYSNNNNKTLSLDENSINNNLKISYIKNNSILMINNNSIDAPVQKVTIYNILGQSISTWKIENQDQQNIQQPIKNLSSGIYIAKVKTSNGDFSKKIIIP